MNTTPAKDIILSLIRLEEVGIPIHDFSNALLDLALIDRFTNEEMRAKLGNPQSIYSGHNADHIARVVFWVLYLVRISTRLGYSIDEDEALAAVLAALVHDLSRVDELPGGAHGELAAEEYAGFLKVNLSAEMASRSQKAVRCHGYAEEPDDSDVVWMLLKDADALDRGRFAHVGDRYGLDPTRLRLPVLKENQFALDGCLSLCPLLPVLIRFQEPADEIFNTYAHSLANRLVTDTKSENQVIQQVARSIVDELKNLA